MSIISLLLNLLWIVFGGWWMALGWVIAAVVMAITIVGLPWARAAFNIAAYTLLPFGYKAVPRDEYFGHQDVGTGPLGVIGNIVWLFLAGWWLSLGHLVTAIVLAVTIVGIPFAWAHLKLAGLALWPIGKAIVPVQNARLASSQAGADGRFFYQLAKLASLSIPVQNARLASSQARRLETITAQGALKEGWGRQENASLSGIGFTKRYARAVWPCPPTNRTS